MKRNAPMQGGVRRRRNKAPNVTSTGDASVITYSALGTAIGTGATIAGSGTYRLYAGGDAINLTSTIGPSIVKNYSTCKFLPGTRIRWEPSVSFNTSGRVTVGFTDNPEVVADIYQAWADFLTLLTTTSFNTYANKVRALGSVQSFPVWQETDVTFPTRLRRKRFDVNAAYAPTVDNNDRSVQTAMFVVVDGVPLSTTFGSFWYHDKVDVEGIHSVST